MAMPQHIRGQFLIRQIPHRAARYVANRAVTAGYCPPGWIAMLDAPDVLGLEVPDVFGLDELDVLGAADVLGAPGALGLEVPDVFGPDELDEVGLDGLFSGCGMAGCG
jgi:hypothetical protein